jgi:hypothetical protein
LLDDARHDGGKPGVRKERPCDELVGQICDLACNTRQRHGVLHPGTLWVKISAATKVLVAFTGADRIT